MDYRNSLNRLYFLICLSLSILALFGYPIFFTESKEKEFFLYQMAVSSITPFYAFNLHFAIEFTRKKIKRWLKAIIYLPAIIYVIYIINSK